MRKKVFVYKISVFNYRTIDYTDRKLFSGLNVWTKAAITLTIG